MDETKQWYQSRAVWAGIVAAIVGILGTFGVEVPDSPDSIADNIVALIVAVAGIITIIGRVTAKKKIVSANNSSAKLTILIVLFTLVSGCFGPITVHDPAYLVELDNAVGTTRALAEQCYAGQLDPNECCDGLDAAYNVLNAFSDAAHGRDVKGGDK
ncbi:MAG TPA: hypothetical protein HPP87_04625 [Planctomycetes bacterium]|nr:hypothetical protein [Planctomycetota bacterium]HIJ70632.1 hypothetical protein [Planctomycetota bacterium]